MFKSRKLISIVITCAMVFSLVQITALGAYTAPTAAETQFNEDFEDYQILSTADEYKADYYDGTSVYQNVINLAVPADKVNDEEYFAEHSDKFPNGTANVYEGNLADAGMQVPDPEGTLVLGGTKNIGQDDGWFGYYAGGSSGYNVYNRRLSVWNRVGTSEINQTQFASFQPKATDTVAGRSELNRNNVALDGYSFISARVNLSAENPTTEKFGKAGIALTKNPSNQIADATYDVVYFTDSETQGYLNIYFNGAKLQDANSQDIKIPLSKFKYTSKAVESTGEWYTIQYRLYNKGNVQKHKITIINDVTKAIVVQTDWANVNLDEGGFDFAAANTYGIRFFSFAKDKTILGRMRLDDISFHNDEYVEDFDSYNLAVVANSSTSDRIGNGPKGNRLSDSYANGVYEGNMAKNVFVAHSMETGAPNWDTVLGNITQWQGWVKVVSGVEEVRFLGVNPKTTAWQYPCTVVNPTDRKQAANGFDTQALVLRANTAKPKKSQAVYAGMDRVDFSDKTTLSAVFKIQDTMLSDDSFALQLTKGRDTGVGKASTDYAGTSHTAYYDVLKFQDGKILVGSDEIGTYANKNAYRLEYTVDVGAKTQEIKIFNNVTDELVAKTEEASMGLNTGADNFNFENDVTGFRFVADAPTYTDAETYGDIVVFIDDVKVSKVLPASVTGENNIAEAIFTLADGEVKVVLDMAEATESGVLIFAAYSKETDKLWQAFPIEVTDLEAGKNTRVIPDVTGGYTVDSSYAKVFFWNTITDDLTPITQSADAIID